MRAERFCRFISLGCGLALGYPVAAQQPVTVWLTTQDRAHLLERQTSLSWHDSGAKRDGALIDVDDKEHFQTIEGFGHALTGGSAQLLMKMSPKARAALLEELFGSGPGDIHTSYLRVTVGASDMNDHVYTYDDMAAGQSDPLLAHFSLAPDEADVLPVLRQILAIEPHLHILASPWTAPAFMKSNDAFKAGSLKPEFYDLYAHYLVKYLQAMKAAGISIEALTPQNEPENGNNTPSMLMTATEQADFIGKHLGPAIQAAGLHVKIIAFDHNCDHPEYSETVFANPDASRYTDGAGFHLYLGKITALTTVHAAFPAKNLYFTEQMVIPEGDPAKINIAEPVARLIVGAPANWARTVLLWNLAADRQKGPHTPDGGCPVCAGALMLDGDRTERLVAYYVVAHASKFVPPGSTRIASNTDDDALAQVAFLTPGGLHVLVVSNTKGEDRQFSLRYGSKLASTVLPGRSVATYTW